jgi:hypothetical protein
VLVIAQQCSARKQTIHFPSNTICSFATINHCNLYMIETLLDECMLCIFTGASGKALRFLSKYVEEKNIQGYYGPVIDLFDCNER